MTAECCLYIINKRLKDFELTLQDHIVGMVTDGASVMMGEHKSMSPLYKTEHPKLVVTWAVAHRLELAVNDACAVVIYLDTVEELLKDLYAFLIQCLCKAAI